LRLDCLLLSSTLEERLRRRRIQAGLNQKELAAAVGISASHMSWLERGLRGASPRVLRRCAEVFECQVADLMPPESTAEDKAGAA
jgi:transcriptional regulator with XRE-family HTH domain